MNTNNRETSVHGQGGTPAYSERGQVTEASPSHVTGTSAPRDLWGRCALVIAIIASVLAIVLGVITVDVPFMLDANEIDTSTVYNVLRAVEGLGVGALALVAVILAAVSMRAPARPRGVAAAGLALGAFHLVSVLIQIVNNTVVLPVLA